MDLLKEWPEPIVPVQAIAETGGRAIPDRYVKPPSERPSSLESLTTRFGQEPEELNIPLVDLGGLSGSSITECRATMSDACREWGFFQVVNHGVSLDLVAKMKTVWRDFFFRRLPVEEKLKLANSPTTYEGYGSRVGVQKGAILDWGDYYFLHVLPDSIKNYSKWPAHPSSCREVTDEYAREMAKLCGTLMKVMSLSLGLDVGFLQKAFGGDEVGACMRMNYYPKCPQPDLTLGLSAHSDPGGLTVLLADDRVKGLQVRKRDAWVTVQPVPNAFIVNIGDQIQVLSNAIYKSVEHRVIANADEERFSVAFFYNPRSDLPVCPARELVTPDRPQLYQPMTFDEYRLDIRKKGPRGKAQIESMMAMQIII